MTDREVLRRNVLFHIRKVNEPFMKVFEIVRQIEESHDKALQERDFYRHHQEEYRLLREFAGLKDNILSAGNVLAESMTTLMQDGIGSRISERKEESSLEEGQGDDNSGSEHGLQSSVMESGSNTRDSILEEGDLQSSEWSFDGQERSGEEDL